MNLSIIIYVFLGWEMAVMSQMLPPLVSAVLVPFQPLRFRPPYMPLLNPMPSPVVRPIREPFPVGAWIPSNLVVEYCFEHTSILEAMTEAAAACPSRSPAVIFPSFRLIIGNLDLRSVDFNCFFSKLEWMNSSEDIDEDKVVSFFSSLPEDELKYSVSMATKDCYSMMNNVSPNYYFADNPGPVRVYFLECLFAQLESACSRHLVEFIQQHVEGNEDTTGQTTGSPTPKPTKLTSETTSTTHKNTATTHKNTATTHKTKSSSSTEPSTSQLTGSSKGTTKKDCGFLGLLCV